MLFRLLGPLEVESAGSPIRVAGGKERALLALLLLRANRPVSRDVLIDELWGEQPPASAKHTLEAHLSRLRRAMEAGGGDGLIESLPGGYRIHVDDQALDVLRFERLCEEGTSALADGKPDAAEEKLTTALELWRGEPLADLADEPFAVTEAARLGDVRLSALEARAAALLALGRHGELVGELSSLVAEHPLRETLRARLMLALYRAGRQADALAVYQEGRRLLVDELGIEPRRELQELQEAILRHDAAVEPPPRVAPAPAAAPEEAPPLLREQRKVVTIVFCDGAESTVVRERLDPEQLSALLPRYAERIGSIVGRYGGTVETFADDVIMAVFGVPVLHEDDPLRAVRAAVEMRAALGDLGVEARVGVNTGEVVTGSGARLVIGDAVNVAARLQRAARPADVLIGETTRARVGGAVEAERVGPLAGRADGDGVLAFRVLRFREVTELREEPRFVGRELELALLRETWRRVQAERRCELATVVGDAGVGKTRLVGEFVATVDATVVRGRCRPYGEGITYWPVVEALNELLMPAGASAVAATRSLLGETATAPADEIAWAVRKTFEHAAGERPLVVVFDDIHEGEQTFLDLVEHVALLSAGAPMMLVCMARPELTERRPAWPVALRLRPLRDEEAQQLIPERISPALRARIALAAGGNPLFVREMVAMVGEADRDVVVPPTLQALLAARLDRLDAAERSALQRGAVEGEIFHRGAVHALSPDEPQLSDNLTALVRMGLIRPETPQLPGEGAFRFSHLLMRDAAYDALPKATRAELHTRFAGWLEERGAGMVELDQILGYHLEQAVRYRAEVGLPDDAELRAAARRRLTVAGRRAYLRQDYPAAAGLLKRAAALLAAGELDVELELEVDLTAVQSGARARQALRHAGTLAERAAAAGDKVGELCARLEKAVISTWVEPEGATADLAALVEEALPAFEAVGDDRALCRAHAALAVVLGAAGHMDELAEACDRAAARAAQAGLADRFIAWRTVGRFFGTTTLSEFLRWQDELDEADRRHWVVREYRGWATAMLGHIDEARRDVAGLCAELAERGTSTALALAGASAEARACIERLAGDPAAAAALGEQAWRSLEGLGERGFLSCCGGWVAQSFYELGRLDEADAWAGRSSAAAASDDAYGQMLWRQVRAKVLAHQSEYGAAEGLASEAVAIAERTEMLNEQAAAYADLGEVLSLAGRTQEAADALEEALRRYERKENVVMAERTRTRLAEIWPALARTAGA